MLESLHVKNLALIEEEEIEFKKGLNILTGETGAGKSIIIGSISLALGAKAGTDVIRSGADEAYVELVFDISDDEKERISKEFEIAGIEEGKIIISRRITQDKSIFKVNGEKILVSELKKLTSRLIDIHGQHEHQSLLNPSYHVDILDEYMWDEIEPLRVEMKSVYNQYMELKKRFDSFNINDETRRRDISFLKYEIEEINAARLSVGEDAKIEKEYERLSNAKKIIESMSRAAECLDEEVSMRISQSIKFVGQALLCDEELKSISSELYDLENLFGDVSRGINSYLECFDFNEERFFNIVHRIDTINSLKSKYGNTIEDILDFEKECEEKLQRLIDYDYDKNSIVKELFACKTKVDEISKRLSTLRKDGAKSFSEEIENTLLNLNFNYAKLDVNIKKGENYTEKGYDTVEFLISTNPGECVKPLAKVASGGELSRIMLALKSIAAGRDDIGTLIFDEIDTGISGITAQKVAEKMAYIAAQRQVIAITHLPQIAAMADTHFLIEKHSDDDKTVTSIKELGYEASVMELGRIIGGENITDAVTNSAREMKELSKKSKEKNRK